MGQCSRVGAELASVSHPSHRRQLLRVKATIDRLRSCHSIVRSFVRSFVHSIPGWQLSAKPREGSCRIEDDSSEASLSTSSTTVEKHQRVLQRCIAVQNTPPSSLTRLYYTLCVLSFFSTRAVAYSIITMTTETGETLVASNGLNDVLPHEPLSSVNSSSSLDSSPDKYESSPDKQFGFFRSPSGSPSTRWFGGAEQVDIYDVYRRREEDEAEREKQDKMMELFVESVEAEGVNMEVSMEESERGCWGTGSTI